MELEHGPVTPQGDVPSRLPPGDQPERVFECWGQVTPSLLRQLNFLGMLVQLPPAGELELPCL